MRFYGIEIQKFNVFEISKSPSYFAQLISSASRACFFYNSSIIQIENLQFRDSGAGFFLRFLCYTDRCTTSTLESRFPLDDSWRKITCARTSRMGRTLLSLRCYLQHKYIKIARVRCHLKERHWCSASRVSTAVKVMLLMDIWLNPLISISDDRWHQTISYRHFRGSVNTNFQSYFNTKLMFRPNTAYVALNKPHSVMVHKGSESVSI
jgi:hypothetical protein